MSGEEEPRQRCPQCGRDSIVYNGNYFCSYAGRKDDDPRTAGCGWMHPSWPNPEWNEEFEKKLAADEQRRREQRGENW